MHGSKAYLSAALFFLVLTSVHQIAHGDPQKLVIGADPWCPYNCDPQGAEQGLMIDIARAAMALSGYQVEYQTINWARAKRMVSEGKLDGIVGMARTPTSEPLYFFSNMPLGISQVCFFRRADDNWQYSSTESLINRTMGWINDYKFGSDPSIDDWVNAHKNDQQIATLSGLEVHNRLFQMLLRNRIDTFAEDRNVIAYELKKQNLLEQIAIAGCSKALDEVHVAFSLSAANRQQWATALESGVESLRKSGQLAKILALYGLTEASWMVKNP